MTAVIEITSRCENSCDWCSSLAGPDKKDFMAVRTFTQVLHELRSAGADTLCISGGEPFLHPELTAMLRRAEKAGFKKIYVYTSGIGRKNTPVVLPEEFQDIATLVFGVASFTKPVYNLLTNTQGKFSTLMRAMQSCSHCLIHFFPAYLNLAELYTVNLDKLQRKFHLQQFCILRPIWHGRAEVNRNSLYISEDTVVKAAQYLKNRFPDVPVKVSHPWGTEGLCTAGDQKLVIDVEGNAYPCEAFKHDKPFGNIMTDKVSDILMCTKEWKDSFSSKLPCTLK